MPPPCPAPRTSRPASGRLRTGARAGPTPGYLPTGESLYSVANVGSYHDPKATSLIDATITAPAGKENQALSSYAQYMAQQVPVVYGPTSIGTYEGSAGTLVAKNLGGYAANALGLMNPEDWYFTK